jgi:hypothetical protein
VLLGSHLGVEQIGTREELGVRHARHQAGDSHSGVLELVTQRIREGVDERLAAVIYGLEGPGHEAGDGSGDENPAFHAAAHVTRHFLHEVERAGDVRVDHVLHFGELLVQESFAEAMPGVGQQRVDVTTSCHSIELLNPISRGKVRLDGVHLGAERSQGLRGGFERFICGDDEVVAAGGGLPGKLQTDAAGSPGDDRERSGGFHVALHTVG